MSAPGINGVVFATVKLRRVGRCLVAGVPVRVAARAGLREGDYVIVSAEEEGTVEVRRYTRAATEMQSDLP